MECLGCRIANHIEPNVHVVYENEFITAVLDIAPFNEGHLLILPKRHFHELTELDLPTLTAIMNASQLLSNHIKAIFSPDGITVCQNGGVFNDLTHYHMHLIPRYLGDGFYWSEPIHPHGAEMRLSETLKKIKDYMEISE